jgi:DNA-binding phage protein
MQSADGKIIRRERNRGINKMTLTRDFKETIQVRAQRDPAFRKELLREGIESLLAGDVNTGKTVLRDYINATVGFSELAEVTHRSSKSLMRMLGPKGNPNARNMFAIVAYLQQQAGIRFKLCPQRAWYFEFSDSRQSKQNWLAILRDGAVSKAAAHGMCRALRSDAVRAWLRGEQWTVWGAQRN